MFLNLWNGGELTILFSNSLISIKPWIGSLYLFFMCTPSTIENYLIHVTLSLFTLIALLIVMHERQIDKYFFFTQNFNPCPRRPNKPVLHFILTFQCVTFQSGKINTNVFTYMQLRESHLHSNIKRLIRMSESSTSPR